MSTVSSATASSNTSAANLSALTPALVAKKISEIVPANTKETIEEAKQYLNSQKLDLDGYRQIWKGIFFAMWSSDKVPVQQALADELANLIFSVYKQKFEAINMWFQACFSIMNKEWNKIDYWRVNKFSSMMRKVVTAFVRYLRKKNFNIDYVRQFSKTIYEELYVEVTQTVGGLALHIMQIFPEVLSNFTRANSDQIALFLDLFLKQLNPNACKNLRQKIKEAVFDKIVELKVENNSYQNLNMKAYREKLFDIAKKKNIDEISRKDIYDIIENIDAKVNLEEEEGRYKKYMEAKEQNRLKVLAEKKEKKASGKKEKETNATEAKKKNKETKETSKKEDKTNKKANLEGEEGSKIKKQKLNDATAKVAEAEPKQQVAAKTTETKSEEKLTKQQKKELKKQEKLQQMIEEEEKKLSKQEKKLSQMEQKLTKEDKQTKKDVKEQKKTLQKEVEEENEDDDEDFEGEEENQDWEDEDEEDDDDFANGEGDEDEEEDDDEDFEDENAEDEDDEYPEDLNMYQGGDDEEDEELDEEELQMLIKGTADDIEIDDMDDDFYCEDDFEGYEVPEVVNNLLRINGLQKVYNSLPEYHFLSDPQKTKYFNNLTTKFKTNLLKEKIDGCSHKKSVIINTNNNLIKEFDLNEEVTAIAKAPVLKKAKKVKSALSN